MVDGEGKTVGAAASAAPSEAAPSEAASAATGGVTVSLSDTSLGKVITGANGMTLYLFTPDSKGKSACTGDCASSWPPLTSDAAPTLGAGLDAEDFSTITRDDGSKQVTFYGHPVYYFAGDTVAGQTSGQGLGGKWYVINKEGNAVE